MLDDVFEITVFKLNVVVELPTIAVGGKIFADNVKPVCT